MDVSRLFTHNINAYPRLAADSLLSSTTPTTTTIQAKQLLNSALKIANQVNLADGTDFAGEWAEASDAVRGTLVYNSGGGTMNLWRSG